MCKRILLRFWLSGSVVAAACISYEFPGNAHGAGSQTALREAKYQVTV